MANSARRRIDNQGRMFIPMNVEGGGYDEKFLDTKKVVWIVSLLMMWIFITLTINSTEYMSKLGKNLLIIGGLVITFYVVRFAIFEERYYYKMYKKMQLYSNPTTDVFWNVASIKDTNRGSILMYSDMRVGVIIKLERDSIIGRDDDFIENHFDAVSDFYRELMLRDLSFVQLNMMEQAGKDPRLPKLDKLVMETENPNVKMLLELELGYIKNLTRATLYETDYILIYSNRLDRIDTIIDDVEDCAYRLLDGAYVGYDVLNSKEIIDLHKEIFGISYFDYSEAAINTFRTVNVSNKPAVELRTINLNNGSRIELTNKDILAIKRLASYVENGSINEENISILDALEGNKFRNNYGRTNDWGVDIGSLAQNLQGGAEQNNQQAKQVKQKENIMNKQYQVRKKVVPKAPQPMKKREDVEAELRKKQEKLRQMQSETQKETEELDDDYIDF